jgi:hypothetical protein
MLTVMYLHAQMLKRYLMSGLQRHLNKVAGTVPPVAGCAKHAMSGPALLGLLVIIMMSGYSPSLLVDTLPRRYVCTIVQDKKLGAPAALCLRSCSAWRVLLLRDSALQGCTW